MYNNVTSLHVRHIFHPCTYVCLVIMQLIDHVGHRKKIQRRSVIHPESRDYSTIDVSSHSAASTSTLADTYVQSSATSSSLVLERSPALNPPNSTALTASACTTTAVATPSTSCSIAQQHQCHSPSHKTSLPNTQTSTSAPTPTASACSARQVFNFNIAGFPMLYFATLLYAIDTLCPLSGVTLYRN